MSRKADSMSVLARKQPCPKRFMPSIALSIVTYWRLKSSFGIEELMLVVPDFGNERWNIVRNLSEFFFGTKPIGETWKLGNGGVSNGPATRPREISFSKFEVTMLGWATAVGKFFENLGVRSPSNPIRTPYLKLSHNCDTNRASGCPASVFSSQVTTIGVGVKYVSTLALSPVKGYSSLRTADGSVKIISMHNWWWFPTNLEIV